MRPHHGHGLRSLRHSALVSVFVVLLTAGMIPSAASGNTLPQGSSWFVYGQYDETYKVTGPKLVTKQVCPTSEWSAENTPLPEALADFGTAMNSSTLWISGGYDGTTTVASVRSTALSGTGEPLGSWASGPALPSPVRDHAMETVDRWLFVLGGRTDGAPRDSIQVAEFKFDGSLLDWNAASRALPSALWNLRAVSMGGFLYVIGGCTDAAETSATTNSYYTRVLEDGSIEPWQVGPPLPSPRTGHVTVASSGRIWVLGGADAGGTIQSTAYYSDVDPQTGSMSAWQSGASLPVALRDHAAAIQDGVLTVLGGRTPSAVVKTVYTTKINADLSLAGWTAAGSLRREVERHEAGRIHGRLFRVGGRPNIGGYLSDAEYTTLGEDLAQAHAYQGRFTSRSIDLGFSASVEQVSWTPNGSASVGLRWRAAAEDGVWGEWSGLFTSTPVAVGVPCRYFQYQIEMSGDGTQTVEVTAVSIEVDGVYYLQDSLSGAQAWTVAGGPFYVVYSDLTLQSSCNLVIEPGVRVHFGWGAGLRVGTGAIVNATGAPGDSIYFSSLDGNIGRWKGVSWASNASSSLRYCVFEKAGELWSGFQDNLHCTSTAQPDIENCVFRWSSHDGVHLSSSSTILEACSAYGNGDAGIRVTGRWTSGYPIVSRCGAWGNEDGIIIASSNAASPTTIQYCDVHTNARDGVQATSSSTPCLYLNTIHGNGRYPVYVDGNSWVEGECWTGNTYWGNAEEAIAFEGRTISADRTLADVGDPYRIVVRDLTVSLSGQKPTLTVGEGVAIEFGADRGLAVGGDRYYPYGGQLRAVGTAENPIHFGPAPNVANWKGLLFDCGSMSLGATSTLDHCIVEGAGGTWGDNVIANVYCRNTSQPTILRSRLLGSSGVGLYLDAPNAPSTVYTDSTAVDSCGSYPIYIGEKSWLDPGTNASAFRGNGIQAIGFEGRTVSDALTLVDRGVPYRVLSDVLVEKSSGVATLTVGSGACLQFASTAGIRVGGTGATTGGQLFAIGDADRWIRFDRIPGGGAWKGLYFADGSNYGGAASILRHCRIDGAEGTWGAAASIYSNATSQPSLRRCEVVNATSAGLHLAGAQISMDSTRVDSCGTYPVYINTTSSLSIGAGANSYAGNQLQAIGYEGRTFAADDTLIDHGIPYRVLSSDLIVRRSLGKPRLTVEAGVTIELTSGRGLQIGGSATEGGELSAIGEPSNWIRFVPAAGADPKGLYFTDGSDYDGGASHLEYCAVSGARGTWGGGIVSGIRCAATTQPAIRHTAITDAGQTGLYLESSSRVLLQDSRVDSCGTYPIHLVTAAWLDSMSAGNTFSGNQAQAVAIAAQTVNSNARLVNPGIPYRAQGDLTVSLASGTPLMKIDAGTTMEFPAGAWLSIGGGSTLGGRLYAVGTPEERITFAPAPGSATWDGLRFNDGSDYQGKTSTLAYCTIRGASAGNANVYCSSTSQPMLEDCLVMGAAENGIYLSTAPIAIRRCYVTGNGTNGIYTSGSSFTIGGEPGSCNRIEGNTQYELRLASNHNVDATYNWWGGAEEGFIQSEIYDRTDSGTLGIVTYNPWSVEACGEWPVPEPFHVLLPEDGIRVLTLTPSFLWRATTGGTGIVYDLEVADNPDFVDALIVPDLPDTSHDLQTPLTDGVTWHWRVRARNELGLTRTSIEARTVLTNIPPTVPDPIYPIDKDVCVPEWHLVWLESVDAGGSPVTYRVQVDDDPTFSSPEIDAGGIAGERAAVPNAVAVLLGSLPGAGDLVPNRDYFWRVEGYDFYPDGSGFSQEQIRFYYLARAQDVTESPAGPGETLLEPVSPNPASSHVAIAFTLARASDVRVEVFDVHGRRLGMVISGVLPGGRHMIPWNLTNGRWERLRGGLYWIRLQADGVSRTRRLLVIR